ncbi:MAG: DUF5679 domain-containing protein [Alphaproteobacteria bacterium]|jgi:hypothetical protein|nr:DUF5679 domain-containing protein [Alphaproteobacteria bacterium]
MVSAYCVKCKEKGVTMKDPAIHQTKKGGYMAKGACPKCSTTLCAIMSEANAQKAIKDGVKKAY